MEIFMSNGLPCYDRRQIGDILQHLRVSFGVCGTDKAADAFSDVLLLLMIPEGVGQDVQAVISKKEALYDG